MCSLKIRSRGEIISSFTVDIVLEQLAFSPVLICYCWLLALCICRKAEYAAGQEGCIQREHF